MITPPIAVSLFKVSDPIQYASIVMTDPQIRQFAGPGFGGGQSGTIMWPIRSYFIQNFAAGAYTNGPNLQTRTSPVAGGAIYGQSALPTSALDMFAIQPYANTLANVDVTNVNGRQLETGFTAIPTVGNPANTMQVVVPFVRVSV